MNPIPWLIPGPGHAVIVCLVLVLWLHRPRLRASRLARLTSLVALCWIWLASTPALGNLLVRALEDRYPAVDVQQKDVRPDGWVVVLASGQMFKPDGTAAPILDSDGWERLLAGVALWRRVGGTLVLAGGPGHGQADSLAQVMRRIAMDAGVPANAIMTAGGGRNTYEDLRAAAGVIKARSGEAVQAGPTLVQPLPWLVTSALHMPRSVATAAAMGLQVRPAPCGFRQLRPATWRAWLPDNGDPALWRDGLHEWLDSMTPGRWAGGGRVL
jgi:uncharacterized SAM-binding protein YcdF (DUF218 family)